MNCSKEYLITQYIDGQLSEHQAQEVRKHLLQCMHCKKVYEEIKKLKALIESIKPNEEIVEPSFEESLMATRKILRAIQDGDYEDSDFEDVSLVHSQKKNRFYFIAASVAVCCAITSLFLYRADFFHSGTSPVIVVSVAPLDDQSAYIPDTLASGGETVILPEKPLQPPEIQSNLPENQLVADKINSLIHPPDHDDRLIPVDKTNFMIPVAVNQPITVPGADGIDEEPDSSTNLMAEQIASTISLPLAEYISRYKEAISKNDDVLAFEVLRTAKQNYPADKEIQNIYIEYMDRYEKLVRIEKQNIKEPVKLQLLVSQRFYPVDVADAGSSVPISYKEVINEYGDPELIYDPANAIATQQLNAKDNITDFRRLIISIVTGDKVKGKVVNRLAAERESGDVLFVDIPVKNLPWLLSVLKTHGEAKEILGPYQDSFDIDQLDLNSDEMFRMQITVDISKDVKE